MSLIRHVHQHLSTVSRKAPLINVTIDLGKLGEIAVNHMLALELSTVLIETVSDEDGYVIHPRVTRRSG